MYYFLFTKYAKLPFQNNPLSLFQKWVHVWDVKCFFDPHEFSLKYRYFQGIPEAVSETEQRGGCACWTRVNPLGWLIPNILVWQFFIFVLIFLAVLVIHSHLCAKLFSWGMLNSYIDLEKDFLLFKKILHCSLPRRVHL